ncbi:MAG: PQQ-binding-like beta-propeller repeat protein [Verrucomicrobiales bacterium]|nr:PQQ-binding-like beta-propeller repeat protein [Verrucomicrobiales bacterium]
MKKISLSFLVLLVVAFAIGGLRAQDWPMWRYDAHRSAASPHDLPADLHLQWSRELPAVRAAWPNENRLHFDTAYHPVVLNKILYLGSPNDSSLTAYDTETGQELWKYYTDGPVRLAPVAANGKVYLGSDDGYLYCLDASSGEQVWKFRAAPADRPEKLHLGNNRLISYWPVRGGPVISKDGKTLYLASGVWPSLGIFIHSLNAETGKVNWTNNNTHFLPETRIDHNYLEESALSPQGHMLIAKGYLIIPNGRSMPARIDLKTGKLQHFVQGYRSGDCRVIANEQFALVGKHGVVTLNDGREIGADAFVKAGKEAPQSWSTPKRDQFEGPFWQYKRFEGCDYRSVLDGDIAFSINKGALFAHDLGKAVTGNYEKEANGKTYHPTDWKVPELWKIKSGFGNKKTEAVIKAGGRLYTHFNKELVAFDLPQTSGTKASVAWQKKLDQTPVELVAADHKLFVLSEEGYLLCYGKGGVEPKRYVLKTQQAPTADEQGASGELARKVLKKSGVEEGYALVLGLEKGQLVRHLLRETKLLVVAVDSDKKLLDRLRRELATEGIFDDRFQAIVGDPVTVDFPPYMANLITSESADMAAKLKTRKVYESLRPYGGVAVLPGGRDVESTSEFRNQDDFLIARREGALPKTDQWTHETGNAARDYFSNDMRVKAPLSVLWYGDGEGYGFRKPKFYGASVKPQVAGGRLLALQQQQKKLYALDIYTGRNLWVRDVERSSRYATFPDAIYLAQGRKLDVLDPVTGKTRHSWPVKVNFPADKKVGTSDIRVDGDVIVVGLRDNDNFKLTEGRWDSHLLIALDRKTGKQLWSRMAKKRYSTSSIALMGGRVLCIDSSSPQEVKAMARRGADISKLRGTLFCLDASSGKELWSYTLQQPPHAFKALGVFELRKKDDWVSGSAGLGVVIVGRGLDTVGLKLESGELIWRNGKAGIQPLIVSAPDKTFINQAGHKFNLLTGKLIGEAPVFKKSGGCNYAVGSASLIFVRDRTAAYFDKDSGKRYAIRNLRSGCSNSFVPADGLLNVPCFSSNCVCNYPIQTSFSMYHLPVVEQWRVKQE